MPVAISPDGTPIHYEVAGSEAPGAPSIVCHHGTGGTLQNWHRVGYVERLAPHARLLLIDSRGHGKSDRPDAEGSYALSKRVEDVVAVLGATGTGRAHFWGYSMGGWVGWGAMTYAPERFLGYILGGFGPTPDPYYGRTVEDFYGSRLTEAAQQEQRVMRLIWNETNAFPGAIDVLLANTNPVLLYSGDRDPRYASIRDAQPMNADAEFFMLPGLDHGAAFGQAAADVTPRVVEWLSRVEAGSAR